MAGKIVVSTIQSDVDNSISFISNTGATIFSANLSNGINPTFIGVSTITGDKLVDSSITNAKLVDSSITGVKLVANTVTGDKLGQSSVSSNNIVDASVTAAKLAPGAVSTTSISNGNSNVTIASANSNVSIFSAGSEAARFVTNGNFQFNSGYGSLSTVYGCRAWVNFDGTQVAASMIRSSGNISSMTDNGTGDYTINFTNSMPDTNYCAVESAGPFQGLNGVDSPRFSPITYATGSLRVGLYYYYYSAGFRAQPADFSIINVAFFR